MHDALSARPQVQAQTAHSGKHELTRAVKPQKAMAFLTDEPTMSMNSPPSRVATTEVAMVTTPNVRSMNSCGRSKSSYPACMQATSCAWMLLML